MYFSEQWYGGMDDMNPRVFDAILDQLDLKASRMNTSTSPSTGRQHVLGKVDSTEQYEYRRGGAPAGTSRGNARSRKDRLGEVRDAL